jgi:hypothetical protein
MFAVTTMTKTSANVAPWASTLSFLLVACGGAQVHSGYPTGEMEPWSSPTTLRLNDNGDASADGEVSFPKRERARWYAVDLPASGSLSVRLVIDSRSTGADVGVEVLDAGYNVLAQPFDDNDIEQEEKLRTVQEARAGRTYIHVFASKRLDEVDYRLRVRFEPSATGTRTTVASGDPGEGSRSVFPWTVPNVPPLPAVPATEEAPRRGGRPVAERPPAPEPEPTDPAMDTSTQTVKGRIIEFAAAGSGVKIVINRGMDAGVDQGWTGYVVDGRGRSLSKGSFKIRSVKNDESEGVVGVTLDAIQANRNVVLKPPK